MKRRLWSRGLSVRSCEAWFPTTANASCGLPGKSSHPQSLSCSRSLVISGVLRLAPQLAAFASSLGVTTRLVTAVGHERAATLWAASAIEREMPLRQGLYVGDMADGKTVDLSIMSSFSTGGSPASARRLLSEATILSVAAGVATEQELARVAIAVDDTGRRIDGIVVADPDQTDRTSGRHTMDERSRRPALPMRLTGIASADDAAESAEQEPLMTQALGPSRPR